MERTQTSQGASGPVEPTEQRIVELETLLQIQEGIKEGIQVIRNLKYRAAALESCLRSFPGTADKAKFQAWWDQKEQLLKPGDQ